MVITDLMVLMSNPIIAQGQTHTHMITTAIAHLLIAMDMVITTPIYILADHTLLTGTHPLGMIQTTRMAVLYTI